MSEQLVKFETRGHIGIFTLDRPRAMNAVNGEVSKQFEAHLENFESDIFKLILISRRSNKRAGTRWNARGYINLNKVLMIKDMFLILLKLSKLFSTKLIVFLLFK